tara:strand:- start:36 stop:428 length:393 start_codon:yes stop_codon:yes gene_type:complete
MIYFKKKIRKDVNLIPMINIIFLLLIFFMLTGTIQIKQNSLIERPLSTFSQNQDFFKESQILISIDLEGNFYLDNRKISLEKMYIELSNIEKSKKIFLDLDKRSKVLDFNKIIKAIKENGFERIFIRTIE